MSENCEPEILRIGAQRSISFAQHLIATFAQHTIACGERKAPTLGLRPGFRSNPIDPRSASMWLCPDEPQQEPEDPENSKEPSTDASDNGPNALGLRTASLVNLASSDQSRRDCNRNTPRFVRPSGGGLACNVRW